MSKPAWVASLRIDVECANKAHYVSPLKTIEKQRRMKRPSPLGQCRTPGCMLKAYHLGNCVWRGGYLPSFMEHLLTIKDEETVKEEAYKEEAYDN